MSAGAVPSATPSDGSGFELWVPIRCLGVRFLGIVEEMGDECSRCQLSFSGLGLLITDVRNLSGYRAWDGSQGFVPHILS